jgi:hypothetical protein
MRLATFTRQLRLVCGLLCIALVFSAARTNSSSSADSTSGDPCVTYGAFLGVVHFGLPTGIDLLCFANDDAGYSAIEQYRDVAAALGRLHDVARARFDDPLALDPKISLPICTGHPRAMLLGNHAILRAVGRPDIPMIQLDGAWRVDMTTLIKTGAFTSQDQARLRDDAARINAITEQLLSANAPALHAFAPSDDN